MQKVYPQCYKLDTKGKVRIWYMEQDGDKYRTWDGTQGGKIKASGWSTAVPKNVGRANATTAIEQAAFEIEATYKHKLTREYHSDINDVGKGAHFFEPMLAEKYQDMIKKNKGYKPGYCQPKLDGIRCIVDSTGMWSREGKPINSSPHIARALKNFTDAGHRFDGELYNHDLKEDFNKISSLIRQTKERPDDLAESEQKVQYWIYDLPSHLGTFKERSEALFDLISNFKNTKNPSLVFVPTFFFEMENSYNERHEEWISQGYEGSMWRNGDSLYVNKRTIDLCKRKEFIDEEFECTEILPGDGNWAGVAKRVMCIAKNGKKFGAGIRGTYERAKELINEKHSVVTVRYFQLTPDGVPRFGVVTKFHGEKREY